MNELVRQLPLLLRSGPASLSPQRFMGMGRAQQQQRPPHPDDDPEADLVNPVGTSFRTSNLAQDMNNDPHATAQRISEALSPAQRVLLSSTLQNNVHDEHMNESYVHELFSSAANDHGHMTE